MLKKKKTASAIVYMVVFLVMFLAFSAFAVDGTIVWTNRVKLQNATEATALAAAAEFDSHSLATVAAIESHAKKIFKFLKVDSLSTMRVSDDNNPTNDDISVVIDTSNRKVCVASTMISQPFFLAFLGVNGVELKANACAINEDLPIKASYTGVNWLTVSAAYLSDVLSQTANYNDTAILTPVGKLLKSASYDTSTDYVKFDLIGNEDNKPLSLGPGGFVTIKLPAPIINKTGYDLYIKESGDALEGYMVFAGLDKDPSHPYVKPSNVGAGISWVNITSTGQPENPSLGGLVHGTATEATISGSKDKFYGSGYFDIGAASPTGLAMAKYIRIVDDNEESAIFQAADSLGNTAYKKVNIYGEASTATPGADIDYIKILNHVRLVAGS